MAKARVERRHRDIALLQQHLKNPNNLKEARRLLKAYDRATLQIDNWLAAIELDFEATPMRGDLVSAVLNLEPSETPLLDLAGKEGE